MARRKIRKKENRTIPILFTLGVISWGFFAIDRLTSPKDIGGHLEKKFHNLEKKETSMKQTSAMQEVIGWLHTKLSELDRINQKTSINLKNSNEIVEAKPKFIPKDKKVTLYFYKAGSARLDLHAVERVLSSKDIEQDKYTAIDLLVKGPTAQEKIMNYLDSFPEKPKLLSVKKNGSILIINFNSGFAKNLSHQMIRHQLKQLLKTAKQFPGISDIELQIKSKRIKTLGAEQLALPEKINERSWLFDQLF